MHKTLFALLMATAIVHSASFTRLMVVFDGTPSAEVRADLEKKYQLIPVKYLPTSQIWVYQVETSHLTNTLAVMGRDKQIRTVEIDEPVSILK